MFSYVTLHRGQNMFRVSELSGMLKPPFPLLRRIFSATHSFNIAASESLRERLLPGKFLI